MLHPPKEDTLASKIARERDDALAEITTLKVDLSRAIAKSQRSERVIADLVPRLNLPAGIAAHTKGLDPLDTLDFISKHGGTFQPTIENLPPTVPTADEEKRIQSARSVRSYWG